MTDLSPVVGEAQAPPIERFRKRPLELEMMLWDGTPERADELFAWTGGYFRTVNGGAEVYNNQEHGWIPCPLGHRVAQGALGEFYPVSPAAIAETFDPAPEPLELTPEEQAAAARSEHMSTCHEEACVECMRELRVIRRIVKAIRPVIATELAAKHERELLEARQRAAIHADTLLRITEVLDTINDYTLRSAIRSAIAHGRNAIAAIPVAAALDPTPIPDGEE